MRTSVKRIAAGIATVVMTITLTATPAVADPIPNPDTGLVFYIGQPLAVVARQALPDNVCRPFPATATWLLGWSNFQNVIAYRSTDCSGHPFGLGIFRGFDAGYWGSYTTI